MDILKSINNKILNVYDKIVSLFAKVNNKKWFKPLIGFVIFIIVFAFFFIFTYTHPIYEGVIYQLGNDNQVGKELSTNYRTFLATFDTTYILITGIILIAVIGVIYIYLLLNKRNNFILGIIVLITIAIIIRLTYMGYCDAIFKNQHDVWSDNNTGHLSITFHLFYNGTIPPLYIDHNMSYQLYHFKTAHVIFAGFMQFMKLFVGENQYLLYQSTKIVSTLMSIGIVLLSYYIFKELKLTKRATIFSLILTISFPTLVILGANTNNDTCLFFFTYLSIYLAIKFFKNHSLKNIIYLALALGLTVSAKLSGALIALPIGVMMICVLIKSIQNKTFSKMFLNYVIFALICFPIGLFWGVVNKIVYDYSLTYVWQVTNTNLMVQGHSFLDRFLFLDVHSFFSNPYVILSAKNANQTYNFFDFLVKSQLFGEWSLTKEYAEISMLLVSLSFVFVALLFVLMSYFFVRLLIKKQYSKFIFYVVPLILTFALSCLFGEGTDQVIGVGLIGISVALLIYYFLKKDYFISKSYLAVISVFMIYVVSYVYFNMKEPFACTMDIRYMVPVLSVVAYFFGVYLDKFITQYTKSIKNN